MDKIEYRRYKFAPCSEKVQGGTWAPAATVYFRVRGEAFEEHVISKDQNFFATLDLANEHASILARRWIDARVESGACSI